MFEYGFYFKQSSKLYLLSLKPQLFVLDWFRYPSPALIGLATHLCNHRLVLQPIYASTDWSCDPSMQIQIGLAYHLLLAKHRLVLPIIGVKRRQVSRPMSYIDWSRDPSLCLQNEPIKQVANHRLVSTSRIYTLFKENKNHVTSKKVRHIKPSMKRKSVSFHKKKNLFFIK